MEDILVPNEAVKYILFQRTSHQRFPKTFIYRVLSRYLPSWIYNQVVTIEAKANPSNIKKLYENDMNKDYQSIKDSLPKICSSILDIGCGVAGIDILLSKHYKDKQPKIYLLDKTKIESSVFYGFETRATFYNSLDIAKVMLIRNGIPESCVHLVEATDANEINIDCYVDLVISVQSWGFHYPVETYLEKVYDVLIEGGSLIIDVRKGTNGIQILNNVLGKVDIIVDEKKFHRVLASKRQH